jgi:hypothetical protein
MVDSTGARLSRQTENLVTDPDSIPAAELEGEPGHEPEDEPEYEPDDEPGYAPEREESINFQSANAASTPAGPSQQSRERYEFTEPEICRIINYAETQDVYGKIFCARPDTRLVNTISDVLYREGFVPRQRAVPTLKLRLEKMSKAYKEYNVVRRRSFWNPCIQEVPWLGDLQVAEMHGHGM